MKNLIRNLIGIIALLPALANASDISALYDKVDPSVVVLHTFASSPTSNKQQKGLGSGVIISADGKILTAAHVVHTADAVHVEFKNGKKILAKVIGSEPSADLALLQLEHVPDDISVAIMADSDKVKIGNEIFVIGSPYGLHHTLTVGHISARHSGKEMGKLFLNGDFFQTDAAINRGNSGGPVFNLDGDVIGIVSYIQSTSGGNEGLGFAVTSNTARKLMLERKSYWSGIDTIAITPALARAINYPLQYGVLIQNVADGSIADSIGLLKGIIPVRFGKKKVLLGGDILVAVAGIEIKGNNILQEIRQRINKLASGDLVKFKIYRQGKFITLSMGKP